MSVVSVAVGVIGFSSAAWGVVVGVAPPPPPPLGVGGLELTVMLAVVLFMFPALSAAVQLTFPVPSEPG